MRTLKHFTTTLLLLGVLAGRGRADELAPGSIVTWGGNGSSDFAVPGDNSGFVTIAAGDRHSLGLKADGSIVTWGASYGAPIPNPRRHYVAIASGAWHALALDENGFLSVWGENRYGQLEVPAGYARFIAIAAGINYSFAITPEGTIIHWGSDYAGQGNIPAPNIDFAAVATGHNHNLGLKSDGTIVTWGWSPEGALDVPAPNIGFVAVAAGYEHSLGLKADGRVVAWGDNTSGQCNVPRPNEDFVAIAAGFAYSVALKADGTVVAWGAGGSGALNVPLPDPSYVAIASGGSHVMALVSNMPLLPLSCRVDVMPRSDENRISCRGHGRLIPVAILSDADFDARQVDPASVRFGPSGAQDVPRRGRHGARSHEVDIDRDGDIDLLFQFRFADSGLQCGDTKAEIRGTVNGGRQFSGTDVIETRSHADKDDDVGVLLTASPNPFNPRTTVGFDLPEAGLVRLDIYDLSGRLVRALIDERLPEGLHEADWDGRDASGRLMGSGTYLARLQYGGNVDSVRMALVR